MTFTKRYFADFKDILAIRLVCNHCHTSLSIPVEKMETYPGVCLKC